MSRDLDVRDLAEVMRRVVLPVISSVTRIDEVVQIGVRLGSPIPNPDDEDSASQVWAVISVESDTLDAYLSKAGVGLDDPHEIAVELYGKICDWLSTSVAWGEVREGDFEIPPPITK